MRVVLLCLLAAACASPRADEALSSRLLAGAPIAAPEGLRDYCARFADECGPAVADDLRGRVSSVGAAGVVRIAYDSREAAPQSMFEALLLARTSRIDVSGYQTRAEMVLTPQRRAELRDVNRQINRAIRPLTDQAAHGVEEYWTMPLSTPGAGPVRGDCEDYALEKRARLLALGWAPEMLSLAVAHAPGVGLHAVLIVQTGAGDYVLDNLHRDPMPLARLDYVWLSRQSGPMLSQWAVAHRASFSGADAFEQMMTQRIANGRSEAEVSVAASSLAHAPASAPSEAPKALASDVVTIAAPAAHAPAPQTPASPAPAAAQPPALSPVRLQNALFDAGALCTRRQPSDAGA